MHVGREPSRNGTDGSSFQMRDQLGSGESGPFWRG